MKSDQNDQTSLILSAADQVGMEFARLSLHVVCFVPSDLRNAIRDLMSAIEARSIMLPTTQFEHKRSD